MRRFEGNRLVVATHNKGKLREFARLLGPYAKDIVSAGDLGLPEPEETGVTFAENAILKARAAAKASGSMTLADDSGICVNALDGKPGIYSARWGGPERDFVMAMQRVHKELGKKRDRSAYFKCVLALAWPDGHVDMVEGRTDGHVIWPPRGAHGHGYDPIFVPEGLNRTFAEMAEDEKNTLSHRGKAARLLTEKFFA